MLVMITIPPTSCNCRQHRGSARDPLAHKRRDDKPEALPHLSAHQNNHVDDKIDPSIPKKKLQITYTPKQN